MKEKKDRKKTKIEKTLPIKKKVSLENENAVLCLREEYNIKSKILNYIKNGTIVTIVDENCKEIDGIKWDFVMIEDTKEEGYMMNKFLKKI